MGIGGISVTQLLIILGIVILVFGTKRLKTLGGDLGGALKGFRKAMDNSNDDDKASDGAADEAKKIESGEQPDAEFAEQSENQEQK